MAEYNPEQQLRRLSQLLELSGCKETEQAQILQLVEEMLSRKDPVGFYQELFESQLPESAVRRKAELFRLDPERPGRILVLQIEEQDLNRQQLEGIREVLRSALESNEGQNCCVPMEKGVFAIAYDISKEDDAREFALAMVQSIQEELALQVTVGLSGVFCPLTEAKDAYLQAKTALEAGRKLLRKHVFYAYEELGLAKVVWEMNAHQCRKLLAETLTPEAERELQNKEMLESVEQFFQCDLNISVAARELYVHRNTLVYRIEKFNKASGYNLSDFRDAALVQFLLMVRRRLFND